MSIAVHHLHCWPSVAARRAESWDDVNAVAALLEIEHEEREARENAIPKLPQK